MLLNLRCDRRHLDQHSFSRPDSCPTPQVRNIALCSQLQEVHRSLVSLLPRLPAPAAMVLAGSLDGLQDTAVRVVAPMFKSFVALVEEKVLQMHSAPAAEGAAMIDTSPFIVELGQRLSQFRCEAIILASSSLPAVSLRLMRRRTLRFGCQNSIWLHGGLASCMAACWHNAAHVRRMHLKINSRCCFYSQFTNQK